MAVPSESNAESRVQRAARHPGVEVLARFGYAAKGVVYVVVGGLAVQAVLGAGGETTGEEGALRAIGAQPFGRLLLWALAIGLVGYALWRFVEALLDVEAKGTGAAGLASRGGYLASGVIHGFLALYAFKLATGDGGGGEGGTESATAEALTQPFGAWLVGLAGLAVIGYAGREAYRSYTRQYRREVAFGRLDLRVQRWIDRTGRLGLASRSVVFGLIGFFLLAAALRSDPSQARGLEGALDTLTRRPYGPWLLGIVAAGLVAYGVWSMVKARYRVFPT